MANKYEQGKIYKICDISYSFTYFGSTTEPLSKRMSRHRSDYIRYNNKIRRGHTAVYKIFDEFGVTNCKIELVELFPCNSKIELNKREGEYIINNECVKKKIAGRTHKEYNKEYYNFHKEQMQESSKKY